MKKLVILISLALSVPFNLRSMEKDSSESFNSSNNSSFNRSLNNLNLNLNSSLYEGEDDLPINSQDIANLSTQENPRKRKAEFDLSDISPIKKPRPNININTDRNTNALSTNNLNSHNININTDRNTNALSTNNLNSHNLSPNNLSSNNLSTNNLTNNLNKRGRITFRVVPKGQVGRKRALSFGSEESPNKKQKIGNLSSLEDKAISQAKEDQVKEQNRVTINFEQLPTEIKTSILEYVIHSCFNNEEKVNEYSQSRDGALGRLSIDENVYRYTNDFEDLAALPLVNRQFYQILNTGNSLTNNSNNISNNISNNSSNSDLNINNNFGEYDGLITKKLKESINSSNSDLESRFKLALLKLYQRSKNDPNIPIFEDLDFYMEAFDMPNDFLEDNESGLFRAAATGNLELVKLFIENGSDINFVIPDDMDLDRSQDDSDSEESFEINNDPVNRMSVISAAVHEKHDDIVDHLISLNPKPFLNYEGVHQGYFGLPPLIVAARKDNIAIAKKLIDSGADINIRDLSGNSPLVEACKLDKCDMAKFLLEANAILSPNRSTFNELIEAIGANNLELVKLLIEQYGVDVNITNSYGQTPLMESAEMGNLEIAEYLLEKGADINARTQPEVGGYTALLYAIENNFLGLVKFLLSQDDLNFDIRGREYLSRAIKSKDISMVRLVFDFIQNRYKYLFRQNGFIGHELKERVYGCLIGAVNYIDSKGNSLLMVAIELNSPEIVEFLLYNGADANICNLENGDSAIDLACRLNRAKIIEILNKHFARRADYFSKR